MSPSKKAGVKRPVRAKSAAARTQTQHQTQASPESDAALEKTLVDYLNWSNQSQLHAGGLAQLQLWVFALAAGRLVSTSNSDPLGVGRVLA